MLEKIKLWLGISGTSKDGLLNLLIETCQADALAYTRLDVEDVSKLSHIIIQMVIERYNKLQNEGVASVNYGGISETFDTDYSQSIYTQLRKFKKIKVI